MSRRERPILYKGLFEEASRLLEAGDIRTVNERQPFEVQLVRFHIATPARPVPAPHPGGACARAFRVPPRIYAALGDSDRAFEALERLAVLQPHRVPRLLVQPEMAGLHGDSRLTALRKRFNLP